MIVAHLIETSYDEIIVTRINVHFIVSEPNHKL
jgi:hypothetical protein